MLPSSASGPICLNETIRSGRIQDSGNFGTWAHELEILNILNWPVGSRRGALVEGGGSSCFRRLSSQRRCLSLHLDHVTSPRSSNPACGFPALGSRSRSRARTCEAAPSGVPDRSGAAARKTHVFPDSASGLRPSYRRDRCVARARLCSRPPLSGNPELASLPHVKWSSELCGVGRRSPCRATLSADSAPHNLSVQRPRGKRGQRLHSTML